MNESKKLQKLDIVASTLTLLGVALVLLGIVFIGFPITILGLIGLCISNFKKGDKVKGKIIISAIIIYAIVAIFYVVIKP